METWLTPSVDDVEIFLNNVTVFRSDCIQTRRDGGEALHIKSSLKRARQMKHTAYQQNSRNPFQFTLNVYQA